MKFTTNLNLFLCLFVLAFGANEVVAQSLSYGSALTGEIITEGTVHTYTFDGRSGDVILIRMRGISGGGVDGCLELFDPSGASIAADCDDGGLVKIEGLTLSATGTYTITAKDSGDNDTGIYGLSLQVLNDPSFSKAITCGTDLMQELRHNAQIHGFAFEGSQGDRIQIQMRDAGTNIESQLELYDATGTQIAAGITVVGLTTISDFVLPADGTYTILAMDQNGNDTGFYGLSVQFISADCAVPISCGTTLSSSLSFLAELDAYSFTAIAGNHILVQMAKSNPSIESVVELYAPDGSLIASDAPAQGLAEIEVTSLPVDGDYLLVVKDEKGNDTGDYSLTFQVLNQDNCSEQFSCANPSFTTDLELPGEVDLYAVKAEAGEVLNVRMRGVLNGVDSRLQLYSPAGAILIEDYANGAMAEIVNWVVPQSGTYTIAASDRGGNDTGEYGISLQKLPASPNCAIELNCEATVYTSGLANFAEMDAYTFYGAYRQVLTVTMTEIDIALEPVIKLYGPQGDLLAEQYRSLHADISNFVLPANGVYTILAMDKNGNDIGDYTIDFELNQENGTTTCATCDDGIQNGDETGIDCGGLNCPDCCPPPGTACTICPEDLTLSCADYSTTVDLPMPVKVIGAGTYDMTIRFDASVESSPGNCLFGNVTFDNGCVGIKTGCWAKKLKVTPDYGTCGGPLPDLPFTIDFGGGLKVYFDEAGVPNVLNDNSGMEAAINEWLTSATAAATCDLVSISHDYEPDLTSADCTGSQVVTFTGVDVCGNVSTCKATLNLTDGNPNCPAAGTPCDDGDATTFNDVEDGDCNCFGLPYCEASGEDTGYEFIDYISLGTLINQSGNNNGYADFTTLSTDLMLETEHTIKLMPGFMADAFAESWKVWIDLNQDGQFDATHELIFTESSNALITGVFELPAEAKLGPTRMRISMQFEESYEINSFDACGNFSYGEVEDYMVNLIPFACPEAGTTCDDGDDTTINDAEDGDCNCVGEKLTADRCGTGTISRDVFTGVKGYPLSNIDWESTPDLSDELDIFEIPINQMEHYGTRLRGYLCAPQTGAYTFWISSDDFGELWLSTDDDPANIAMIANVPGWTYPRVWDKYPAQQSNTIYLEAGKRYYVEAYMKEHEGLDNLAVGWQLPNGTLERPIGGANLSPWDGATTEQVNTNDPQVAPTSNALADLQVFPNPAQDFITVDLSDWMGAEVNLTLSNNMGQIIYRQNIEEVNEAQVKIDLNQIQARSGYYNITASSAEQVIAKPLVISKGGQ